MSTFVSGIVLWISDSNTISGISQSLVNPVIVWRFLGVPLEFYYAMLIALCAGAGAVFAGRQIWLQSLPKDQVPACGMGLNYMLESFPLLDVITKVLAGSGECAEKAWELFGLSIAGWTFVFFVAMIVAAIALARRE